MTLFKRWSNVMCRLGMIMTAHAMSKRKQPSKPISYLSIFFWRGYLPGNCLCAKHAYETKASTETYCWNIFLERVTSWKFLICSLIFKKGFLENRYLFDNQKTVLSENRYLFGEHIKGAPGKSVSVRFPRSHFYLMCSPNT